MTDRGSLIVLCGFFAFLVHAALILGLNFGASVNQENIKQLEVTLSTVTRVRHENTFSKLAQTDQIASGHKDERDERGASTPSTMAARETQQGQTANDTNDRPVLTAVNGPDLRQLMPQKSQGAPEPDASNRDAQQEIEQLANLQLEYAHTQIALNAAPRVLRIYSQAAKASVEAEYLRLWRQSIETIGNQYYPESSRRYGIYGDVRVLVAIGFDGRLLETRLLASSGHAVLDQAVTKIVSLAAPYPPFSPEMRDKADQIQIVRTWEFKPIPQ